MVAESVIERAVTAEAIRLGWFQRKVKWIGRDGAPDRVYIRGGIILWVEFKATGQTLRPLQGREHKLLCEAGARVFVVDSVLSGLELLRVYGE